MRTENIFDWKKGNKCYFKEIFQSINKLRLAAKDSFEKRVKILKFRQQQQQKLRIPKKRGMTGYNLFTSEYSKTHGIKVISYYSNNCN